MATIKAGQLSGPRPSTAPLVNHVLKPMLRAYAFGHVSTTGPKLAGLLLSLIAGKRSLQRHIDKLKYVTSSSIGLFRFPAFCASIVGLYSSLSIVLVSILQRWTSSHPGGASSVASQSRVRYARMLAALIAAWTTFPMLNRGDARYRRQRAVSDVPIDPTIAHLQNDPKFAGHSALDTQYRPGGRPPPPLAGRTLDLTIMATVRAAETLIWHAWRQRHHPPGGSSSSSGVRPSRLASAVSSSADPALFIGSCFLIMWSWFYTPLNMPASYRRWIGQAAGVDPRLVEVLRKARWGSFVYGVDTGQAYMLEAMCREHGWPEVWGDPARTVPVPCELVHQGTGPGCHRHKLVKFWRVWLFAMRMYLPLQLALRLRSARSAAQLRRAARRALLEAGRSSAFLGAFVALFYYGVCLSRTLVGPRIFSLHTVTRQMWDSGLCVGAGSALCGWSVLIEPARRRQELALFVLPRAASCLMPGRYNRKYLNRERAAFASGVAVLFALAHESPANVRGILGGLTHAVIA